MIEGNNATHSVIIVSSLNTNPLIRQLSGSELTKINVGDELMTVNGIKFSEVFLQSCLYLITIVF